MAANGTNPLPGAWTALRGRVGGRPVVGITGSYAKTSTKMLLSKGLARQLNVVSNHASYNVIDGIRSTLQRVTDDTDIVVQELGATGPGSLDGLLIRLLPTVGVLTAVADDHLAAFKGREAVLKEKFKIVQALPADGVAVLNIDDPLIAGMLDRVHCRVQTFGRSGQADFRAVNVTADWPDCLEFDLEHGGQVHRVRTRLLGEHQIVCVLAAIATAGSLGMDLPGFIEEIGGLDGPPGRMREHKRADGSTIVMDNVKAAGYMLDDMIDFAANARASHRFLLVGQVSDTSKKEGRLIRSLATKCRERGVSFVTIGSKRKRMLRRESYGFDAGIGVFESVLELSRFLDDNLTAGDLVVVKTNITSGLERIILAENVNVRCRAVACGRRLSCGRCGEIGYDHPPEYRFDRDATTNSDTKPR